MKKLNLRLNSSKAYVRAVSGLFITPKNAAGLTPKEQEMLALLMDHSHDGYISQRTRKIVRETLGMEEQLFYNRMSKLKKKQAIIGEELHSIFKSTNINILLNANHKENS